MFSSQKRFIIFPTFEILIWIRSKLLNSCLESTSHSLGPEKKENLFYKCELSKSFHNINKWGCEAASPCIRFSLHFWVSACISRLTEEAEVSACISGLTEQAEVSAEQNKQNNRTRATLVAGSNGSASVRCSTSSHGSCTQHSISYCPGA